MAEVTRAPDGAPVLALEREEAAMLRRLAEEVRSLVDGADDADPAFARLFPAASDDAATAAAYRDLVGDGLRTTKADALAHLESALPADGGTVALRDGDLDVWLTALNDIRLALGTRLDVDEARMAAPLDESDPQAPALALLHWLGWVQESLLEVRAHS